MRFQAGETIEKIALEAAGGKPIRPKTVFEYIFKALTQGRELDLPRFAQQSAAHECAPPSPDEWVQLLEAEATAAIDVVNAETISQTDLLKTFLPAAAKPAQ